MPKYLLNTTWSGYSRGIAQFAVEADSAEEAEEMWCEGERLFKETMRDDTEHEVDTVEEII